MPPITKKNSQRLVTNKKTGRTFPIPSKQYKDYEQGAGYFLRRLEIATPVNIKCLYYMPTRRRVDLTNLLEATDDILVKYGVIQDDNCGIVVSHDGSRVKLDRECPRTEITITEIEENKDE